MPNMLYIDSQIVEFEYRNHVDNYELRRVVPVSLSWGTTEFYPEPTWLLRAWDIERTDWRVFNWKNIQFACNLVEWKPGPPTEKPTDLDDPDF